MTADHVGATPCRPTGVWFRFLQSRMFRMLKRIELTASYGRHPDINYTYVCAVYTRNSIHTDGPALHMRHTVFPPWLRHAFAAFSVQHT